MKLFSLRLLLVTILPILYSFSMNTYEEKLHLGTTNRNTETIEDNRPLDKRVALLYDSVVEGDSVSCELLLSHGADVNALDNSSYHTALHVALACDQQALVELLFSYGASVTIKSKKGFTVLDYARSGHYRASRELLKKYAELRNQAQSRPTHELLKQALIIGSPHLVKLLLEHGVIIAQADFDLVKNKYEQEPAGWRKRNYATIARMLIRYFGLFSGLSRITTNGLALELPQEIKDKIARYYC